MKYLIPILIMIASPAGATICGPRADIIHVISGKYHEKLVGAGMVAPNRIMEIWSSGGTWTLLVTNAEAQSCVVTVGTDWISKPGAAK